MGIIIAVFFIIWFFRKIMFLNKSIRIIALASLLFYCVFALWLNMYQANILEWENGVPGVECAGVYMRGATEINKGANISDLATLDFRLSPVFSNVGYYVYTLFVFVVVYCPTIVSTNISLAILYLIQILACLISVLNIIEFYNKKTKQNNLLFAILVFSCFALMQVSSTLLRDIWILFFITQILVLKNEKFRYHLLAFFYVAIAFLLRFYSIAITIPIYLFHFQRKKFFAFSSLIIMIAFLLVGAPFLNTIRQSFNITWNLNSEFNIEKMFGYLLMPNVFNQSYNVQHVEASYHSFFGGNTPQSYYLLSLWNLFAFPLIAFGVIVLVKKKNYSSLFFWMLVIVLISVIYSIAYDNLSEPRHKLMIIVPLISILFYGTMFLKKKHIAVYCLLFSIVSLSMLILNY